MKYQLSYGIHRGTLMSRDVGDYYKFKTVEECKEKLEEIKTHFIGGMGMKLWFASITDSDGKKVYHENGDPYY